MVWASRWPVAFRAFYKQNLSLIYSSLSLKNPPAACPGTTGGGSSSSSGNSSSNRGGGTCSNIHSVKIIK